MQDFNLNRYRLAQQASYHEALTFAHSDTLYSFKNYNFFEVISSVKKNLKDGLYTVGLSNHVGFLLKRKGEVFFIHSSYVEPVEVVIERALTSQAFRYSQEYHIASITNNHTLLLKWLNSTEIEILTGD